MEGEEDSTFVSQISFLRCEWTTEIWTNGTDREESLNEWKETEKRDWETVESNYSVEGGEIDSIDRNNLIEKKIK